MTDALPDAGGVGVTLKHNGKYEDPWFTFRGSPEQIAEQVAKFFGIYVGNRTPADIVYEADTLSKAMYQASKQLGGRTISRKQEAPNEQAEGNAWDRASSNPEAEPEPESSGNDMLTAIAECMSVDALKRLWAENRSAFDGDAELMAEWKKRGRELSAK